MGPSIFFDSGRSKQRTSPDCEDQHVNLIAFSNNRGNVNVSPNGDVVRKVGIHFLKERQAESGNSGRRQS